MSGRKRSDVSSSSRSLAQREVRCEWRVRCRVVRSVCARDAAIFFSAFSDLLAVAILGPAPAHAQDDDSANSISALPTTSGPDQSIAVRGLREEDNRSAALRSKKRASGERQKACRDDAERLAAGGADARTDTPPAVASGVREGHDLAAQSRRRPSRPSRSRRPPRRRSRRSTSTRPSTATSPVPHPVTATPALPRRRRRRRQPRR